MQVIRRALCGDRAAFSPQHYLFVLDKHSAHISKETMAFLSTRPGRFEWVHTPKHGSWLNLIECALPQASAFTFSRQACSSGSV